MRTLRRHGAAGRGRLHRRGAFPRPRARHADAGAARRTSAAAGHCALRGMGPCGQPGDDGRLPALRFPFRVPRRGCLREPARPGHRRNRRFCRPRRGSGGRRRDGLTPALLSPSGHCRGRRLPRAGKDWGRAVSFDPCGWLHGPGGARESRDRPGGWRPDGRARDRCAGRGRSGRRGRARAAGGRGHRRLHHQGCAGHRRRQRRLRRDRRRGSGT